MEEVLESSSSSSSSNINNKITLSATSVYKLNKWSSSGSTSGDTTVQHETNIIPLHTDQYNSIYWADIAVNQSEPLYNSSFQLLLDTGSAIAWIANSSCQSPSCLRLPRFSTTTITPTEFYLDYSTGKISGLLVDPLRSNITYRLNDQLPVKNFTLGLSVSVPLFFANYNVSGILGLSANASTQRGTNMVLQLYADGGINSTKFALILDNPSNSNLGGLLFLGDAVDSYAPKLGRSPVQSRSVVPNIAGYWMVQVNQVSAYSNTGINNTFPLSIMAVFDTGTTGLALPLADAQSMHTMLFGSLYVSDGQGNFAFPCNATGSITFNVAGMSLNLSVDLIRADAYTTPGLEGLCSSKMQGLSSTPNWILGAAFLKNYFTIFDVDNKSIGFSPRVALYSYNATGSLATKSTNASTSSQPSTLMSSSTSNSRNSGNSESLTTARAFGTTKSPDMTFLTLLFCLFGFFH